MQQLLRKRGIGSLACLSLAVAAASATPTLGQWFTATDTWAETVLSGIIEDDAGIIRQGMADNGNFVANLKNAAGKMIPAMYVRSTATWVDMQTLTGNTGATTWSPARGSATRGWLTGRYVWNNNPGVDPNTTEGFVYAPAGTQLAPVVAGYNKQSDFGSLQTQFVGGNNKGMLCGNALTLINPAPAGTFTAGDGSRPAGDFAIGGTQNSINDRIEISGRGTVGAPGVGGVFGVWIPKANAARWPGYGVPPIPFAGEAWNNIIEPVTPTSYGLSTGGDSRSINNQGSIGAYAQPSAGGHPNIGQTVPVIWDRFTNTFSVATLPGGYPANGNGGVLAINDGNIGVGALTPGKWQDGGSGAWPNMGIIYHPSFGQNTVDLNLVTAGIPATYTITDATGISEYNGAGTGRFYIAAQAKDAVGNLKMLLLSSNMGDFNASGNVNVADINLLNAAIQAGGNPAAFELTGDGLVNGNDRRMLVEGVLATRLGDTNLDKAVDIIDLGVIGTNWQQNPGTWAGGDFDGSGLVDIVDLGIIGTYWQFNNQPVPSGASMSFADALKLVGLDGVMVPEPSSLSLLALGAIGLIRRRRS